MYTNSHVPAAARLQDFAAATFGRVWDFLRAVEAKGTDLSHEGKRHLANAASKAERKYLNLGRHNNGSRNARCRGTAPVRHRRKLAPRSWRRG